jgi:hypothetical protein
MRISSLTPSIVPTGNGKAVHFGGGGFLPQRGDLETAIVHIAVRRFIRCEIMR